MPDQTWFARLKIRAFFGVFAPLLRRELMTFGLLDGAKTYLVAAAMVVAGLAQMLGVDVPSFDGHAAGQLLMEGLRHGLKTGA